MVSLNVSLKVSLKVSLVILRLVSQVIIKFLRMYASILIVIKTKYIEQAHTSPNKISRCRTDVVRKVINTDKINNNY